MTKVLAVLAFALYPFAFKEMAYQSPYVDIVSSQLTLNFVLLLGGWGYLCDILIKKRGWSKRQGWVFWGVSTFALFALLKTCGMRTIFD